MTDRPQCPKCDTGSGELEAVVAFDRRLAVVGAGIVLVALGIALAASSPIDKYSLWGILFGGGIALAGAYFLYRVARHPQAMQRPMARYRCPRCGHTWLSWLDWS
jgi:ribosomal protein S27AE